MFLGVLTDVYGLYGGRLLGRVNAGPIFQILPIRFISHFYTHYHCLASSWYYIVPFISHTCILFITFTIYLIPYDIACVSQLYYVYLNGYLIALRIGYPIGFINGYVIGSKTEQERSSASRSAIYPNGFL